MTKDYINLDHYPDLDLVRIKVDALGHTSTSFVTLMSVKSCHLCFLLSETNLLQVSIDCAPPAPQVDMSSLVL